MTNPSAPRVAVSGLVATVLENLTTLHDRIIVETPSKLIKSIYHAVRVPDISIREYVDRVARYSKCSVESLVIALIYVDRAVQNDKRLLVSSLNVHRLFLAAVMAAVKWHDDNFRENSFFAKVGGVCVGELNIMERDFIFGYLNCELHVDQTFYARCWEMMYHNAKMQTPGLLPKVCPVDITKPLSSYIPIAPKEVQAPPSPPTSDTESISDNEGLEATTTDDEESYPTAMERCYSSEIAVA